MDHCMGCMQAAEMPTGSLERLLLVAAYAISPYAAAKRVRKPMYAMVRGCRHDILAWYMSILHGWTKACHKC